MGFQPEWGNKYVGIQMRRLLCRGVSLLQVLDFTSIAPGVGIRKYF